MELKRVFISYADEDFAIANKIHDFLKKNGAIPFLARKNIQIGQNWQSTINSELKENDYLILIWSENASKSKWVNYELAVAQVMNKDVLPCAIDNAAHHALMYSIQVLYWDKNNEEDSLSQISKGLGIHYSLVKSEEIIDFKPTFDNAVKMYRDKIAEINSHLSILGSGNAVSIENAYLPLRLSELNNKLADGQQPAYELLESKLKRAVVLGHPGTGKTTLLSYFSYRSTCQNNNNLIPININIPQMMKSSTAIDDFIKILIQGQSGRTISKLIVDDDNFGLQNTKILLDGYDEINESGRKEFLPRINQFLTAYPKCTVFVFSRMSTFDKEPFLDLDFDFYQISELSDEDINAYISKHAPQNVRKHLLSTIRDNERLYELAQVPFMLAMICATGTELGTVVDRASLFEKCTNYLLKTRQDDGRGAVDHELQNSLKAIAVHFFKLDVKEIFEIADLKFAISKVAINLSPDEIIKKIAKRTGLIQRAEGGYNFIHRSIWEYFVALGMKDEPLINLLDRASISRWEEPVKLYLGLTSDVEKDEVIRGIWERNRGLALRSLIELPDFPDGIIKDLVFNLERTDRVRLVHEIISTGEKSVSRIQQKRILLDSISALLRVEKDCEVIYYCVKVLNDFDDEDCYNFIYNFLDIKNSSDRRNKYLNDPNYKFNFITLKKGEYTMGWDESPDVREMPAHRVKLSEFAIGKYLVTNCVFYDSFPFSEDKRNAYSNHDIQPVNNVTWFKAIVFAWWLGCDLPTEAEWEYACRSGGKDDHLFFNPSIVPEYAWYEGNSENRTHKVGKKKANSFGFYDMLGNVREWVKDWYTESEFYHSCHTQGVSEDPVCYKGGDRKVLRGGVFDWSTKNLRPTYRPMNPPENVFFGNGMRLVYRKNKTTPFLK